MGIPQLTDQWSDGIRVSKLDRLNIREEWRKEYGADKAWNFHELRREKYFWWPRFKGFYGWRFYSFRIWFLGKPWRIIREQRISGRKIRT